jgi:hypothetical protein
MSVFVPDLEQLSCKVLQQVKKLGEYIGTRGTPATVLAFPDRTTPIGALISSYLKGESELGKRTRYLSPIHPSLSHKLLDLKGFILAREISDSHLLILLNSSADRMYFLLCRFVLCR